MTNRPAISALLCGVAMLLGTLPATAAREVVVQNAKNQTILEQYGIPAIAILSRPDFYLQTIEIFNDTRDPAQRDKELRQTIRNLVKLAADRKDIDLAHVSNDFVLPLNDPDADIQVMAGPLEDSSAARILIKTPITAADKSPRDGLGRLKAFIKSVPLAGRSKVEPRGLSSSIVDPERYRAEIVGRIAADVKTVTAALGSDYRVSIDGLYKPVSWAETGGIELQIFIPYTYQVYPH